jgi:hypothetical protein
MTLDLNSTVAIALLDRLDTEFPAGSILEIRSGAPAGADNAAGGTLLCSITLPATPWAAAGGTGSKLISGTWADVGTAGAGGGTNAGHFRLKNAAGTKKVEGTMTVTGGGGDATIDNVSIATGQAVTVTSFTFTL